MTSWNTRAVTTSGSQGPQFYEPAWSNNMNNYNVGGTDNSSGAVRQYYWSITFDNFGKQQFNTAVDDSGEIYINGVYQFASGGYNGWTLRETPGYFSPGTYTISMTSRNTGSGPWGLAAQWVGFSVPPPPAISSFYADPDPQNSSSGGTPLYSTTFYWSSTSVGAITSAKILNGAGDITLTNTTGGSYSINNLPQSTAGSSSPSQRVYTLQLCNNGGCSTSPITVEARNDNTPSGGWASLFVDLEPLTNTTKLLGTLANVDMVVKVVTSSNNVTFGPSANGSFSNPAYFTNTQSVYMRSTTLDFNTDISGLGNVEFGKVNNKVIPVTIGNLNTFNVTFRTRAPKIKETFDYSDVANIDPYPDIDKIVNNPQEFTVTELEDINDIEIPVEIKTDNPDVEVQINNGTWVYLREL